MTQSDFRLDAVCRGEAERTFCQIDRSLADQLSSEAVEDVICHLGETVAWLGGHTLTVQVAAHAAAGAIARALSGIEEALDLEETPSIWSLLGRRPRLSRLLRSHLDRRCSAVSECLQRFATDVPLIEDILGSSPGRLGLIRHLALDRGDRHHGARSVVLLEFASGARIAYKPRSLAPEAAWSAFARWLRQAGAPGAPLAMRARDCGAYGWQEFAIPDGESQGDASASFYYASGALAAYMDAVGTTDIHFENVVASAGRPVVVDLEMLCQPRFPSPFRRQGPSAALAAAFDDLQSSVLATGFLGNRVVAPDGRLVEVGALQARPRSPDEGADCGDPRSPGFQFSNLPVALRKQPGEDPFDADAFEAGYGDAEAFLSQHRTWLSRDPVSPLSNFRQLRPRVVFRPTTFYAAAIERLVVEVSQTDVDPVEAAARDLAGFPEWQEADACVSAVLAAEAEAMADLDVPLFNTDMESGLVSSGDRVICSAFFEHTAGQMLRLRLKTLGPKHRKHQLALMRTCYRKALVLEVGSNASWPFPAPLRRALQIGDMLLEASYSSEGGRAWLTTSDGWRHRASSLSVASTDLYSGLAGVGLFLAALAATSGVRQYELACIEVFETIAAEEGDRLRRQLVNGPGLGSGDAGLFYAAALSAVLTGERRLRDLSDLLLDRLQEWSARKLPEGDLMDGSAGLVLACVCAHELGYRGDPLGVARRHTPRLISGVVAGGQKPQAAGYLLGFAHGLAGRMYALARLNRVSPDPAIVEALVVGRSTMAAAYDANRRNWPDLRFETSDPRHWSTNHWCHGAAGILMAHCSLVAMGESLLDVETARLAQANWRSAPAQFDHLCCGGGSTVELAVLQSEAHLHAPAAACADYTRRTAHRLELPLGEARYSPGLMDGASGVGYALLRAAFPDKVPSVCTFRTLPIAPS